MHIYKDQMCTIFFGDVSTSLISDDLRGKSFYEFFSQQPWADIQKTMGIKTGVFGHQVHGITGQIISENTPELLAQPLFTKESDYLITNLPGVGIGIVTADCLPLVLVDQKKKVVGIIHAGWKGLVDGIVENVIDQFQTVYGSAVQDLSLFVGPSAGVCCYEVGYQFLENNHDKALPKEVFYEKSSTLFFDMKGLLRIKCAKKGLLENQIKECFFKCTICTPYYCSSRRSNKAPERQLTIVSVEIVKMVVYTEEIIYKNSQKKRPEL